MKYVSLFYNCLNFIVWGKTYEYVFDRDPDLIFSVLAERDVFLVDFDGQVTVGLRKKLF